MRAIDPTASGPTFAAEVRDLLAAGLPAHLPAGRLLPAGLVESFAAAICPLTDGPLHNDALIVPGGATVDRWTVSLIEPDGSTVAHTYLRAAGEAGPTEYVWQSVTRTSPAPGSNDPTLHPAFVDDARKLTEPEPEPEPEREPEPEPAGEQSAGLDVTLCPTCTGTGFVVSASLTTALRRQTGRRLTVTEQCPSCAGAGGIICRPSPAG